MTKKDKEIKKEVKEDIEKVEEEAVKEVSFPKIGEEISKARKARKQKLVDIASHLKIRRVYLEAIEKCEYDKLPEAPYGLGFIKSYADYLGLDVNMIVDHYKIETGNQVKKEIEYAVLEPEDEASAPTKGYVIASAIFIAILYTIWAGSNMTSEDGVIEDDVIYEVTTIAKEDVNAENTDEEAVVEGEENKDEKALEENLDNLKKEVSAEEEKTIEEVKPVILDEKTNVEIKEESYPLEEKAEEVKEEAKEEVKEEVKEVKAPHVPQEYGLENKDDGEIVILVTTESWIEIKDDGKIILTRVLGVGDKFYAPDSEDLTLSTGNAGGFNIIVDGEVASPIGPSGAVRKDIPLNEDYLFADEH